MKFDNTGVLQAQKQKELLKARVLAEVEWRNAHDEATKEYEKTISTETKALKNAISIAKTIYNKAVDPYQIAFDNKREIAEKKYQKRISRYIKAFDRAAIRYNKVIYKS